MLVQARSRRSIQPCPEETRASLKGALINVLVKARKGWLVFEFALIDNTSACVENDTRGRKTDRNTGQPDGGGRVGR